jgi:hypothetical protein
LKDSARAATCAAAGMPLHDGEVIILGTSLSPYVFKFRLG